jgi:hypothetical protein
MFFRRFALKLTGAMSCNGWLSKDYEQSLGWTAMVNDWAHGGGYRKLIEADSHD